MRKLGLIGGLSWESSIEYYRLMNEDVNRRLGGLHSADMFLRSLDFGTMESLLFEGDWQSLDNIMVQEAKSLESVGVEGILICSNTMHKSAPKIIDNVSVDVIHIVDETAKEIKEKSLSKIILLGTKFTMEEDFYMARLESFGLDVIVPDLESRNLIHDIIFNELCKGEIKDTSKDKYKNIIANLISEGAEGVILGCTEIMLLVNQEDISIPVFDTTTIHAKAAVDFMLE